MAKYNYDFATMTLVLLFVGVFIALYYNEQKRKVVHETFVSGNLPNPMPQMPQPPSA